MNDIIDKIIAYENGEMTDSEIAEFFQKLLDSGLIFKLQGSYQRMAYNLIDEGICENR